MREKKNTGALNSNRVTCAFWVVVLICILFSLGCTKEKKVAQTKEIGCTIYDKLPAEVSKKVEVNFDNKIKLLGTSIKKLSSDQLEVSYFWQAMDKLGRFKTIFVHFTDASDQLLFQNDHDFCPKKTFEELKGKVVKERFIVAYPQSAGGKEIFLKIGVYVPEPDGPRLKIESAKDAAVDGDNTRATVNKISL